MSRDIDPYNITEEDQHYIQQRPEIRAEFIHQGFGDPLSDKYEHLVGKEKVPYSKWSKRSLEEEIDLRNEDEGRAEPLSKEGTKKDLAALLDEDDESQPEAGDQDDEEESGPDDE